MSKRLEKKKLLALIRLSFQGVQLGDGISLHETLEIDDYRRVLPDSTARQYDELYDWQKLLLIDDMYEELCWNGGIHFFDSKGLRFHLPAYLTFAINNQLGDVFCQLVSVLTNVSSDYDMERLRIFNDQQRYCIRQFLRYLIKYEDVSDDDIARMQNAILTYWSKGRVSV